MSNKSSKSARRTVKAVATKGNAKKSAAATVTTGEKVGKLTPKAASNVNDTVRAGLKTGTRGVAAEKGGKAAKKAVTERAERENAIGKHSDAVRKALSSKDGTSVDELCESLGICRKSVRKLLAEQKAVRGENRRYTAK
jgi:hypothetical protein